MRLAVFLAAIFAFSSPAYAQVKTDQGGTGTTANTGLTGGQVLVAQGNGTFLQKTMSGDCTLAASGAISCTASGSSITLDIGDDGGNDSTALAEIATTGDTNGVITEPSADKALIDFTKDWPKADLADALAANGSNCSAGQYARGVDAAGAAESCTADDDSPDNDGEVPNGITVDLSASGQVIGGTASRCAEFNASGVLGVAADACSTGAGGGVTGPGSSTDHAIARYDGTDGAVLLDSDCTVDDTGNLVCPSVEGDCTPGSSDCGVVLDDNSADHAAPGASKNVLYSKGGVLYQRAGAAGSASALLDTAGRSLTKSTNTVDADAELYTKTKCMTIEDPASGDDFQFFRVEAAITVTGIDCLADDGTTQAIVVNECDGNAANCTAIEASIDCAVTNTTEASGIDNAAVDAGDWIRVDPGTNTDTVTQVSVCLTYTVDD